MHNSQLNGSSEFLRHDACPNCGSSDGMAVYDDGHTFCFVCLTWTAGDHTTSRSQSTMNYQGKVQKLSKRKISEKTCQRYKIYRDGDLLYFYYHNSQGVPIGRKVKTKTKDFRYEGESDGSFFGQHLHFKMSKVKSLIITEGELDAASVAEANLDDYAVVSLPSGAAAAKKAIKTNFEFLQSFDKIILFFDNDPAGIKAATDAADTLPPGKAFIARLDSYKDASDALQDDNAKAIREAFWQAKPYRPDGIVDARTMLTEISTPNPPFDHAYPFSGLHQRLHGIRSHSLITITSGSGIGKSSFMRHIASSLLKNGERVGYLPLEESKKRATLGLMSCALGKNYALGEHDPRELVKAFDQTVDKWNLFLFDGFGSFDPDVIFNRIEYLSQGLDCKVIFLDHLSILLSGLDGDERRMIDVTMTRLRSLVERTGITLFLVSHLRRTQQDKNHEEGARVTLGQLRGSAAIAQLSDAVIGLERDQQSSDGNTETVVRVIKNRYSGETGIACRLKYNLDTCQFHETTDEFDPTTDF